MYRNAKGGTGVRLVLHNNVITINYQVMDNSKTAFATWRTSSATPSPSGVCSARSRRYEDASLSYTGVNRHASDTRTGLMDSTEPQKTPRHCILIQIFAIFAASFSANHVSRLRMVRRYGVECEYTEVAIYRKNETLEMAHRFPRAVFRLIRAAVPGGGGHATD